MSQYTPFPQSFPAFALVDAMAVIKDQAVATPAGKLQLAHSGWELAGWALHALSEGGSKSAFFADPQALTGLTGEEAMELLDQVATPPEDNDLKSVVCPISPAVALKLAGWLLKVAEIVIPVIL